MEQIAHFFSSISLDTVFKIYGLMMITFTPIGFIMTIRALKKNPHLLSDLDKKADKILDGKKEEKEGKKEKKEKENDTPQEADKTSDKSIEEKEEEENVKLGIPTLIMQVGDKYKCYLRREGGYHYGSSYIWSTDNKFVGEIEEGTGVFEAKKVGRTYVLYGNEGIQTYLIKVRPKNSDWPGALPLELLMKRTLMMGVKVREIKRKITYIDRMKKIIEYKHGYGRLSYQAVQNDEVERFMFNLSASNDILENIKRNIGEHMTEVRTGFEDRHYWIHQCGDNGDYPGSVDYVAFYKKALSGDMAYFGAGRCWRVGATNEEIADNPEMVERTFADFLMPEDIPSSLGSTLTKRKDGEEHPGATGTKVETLPTETGTATVTTVSPDTGKKETGKEAETSGTEEKEKVTAPVDNAKTGNTEIDEGTEDRSENMEDDIGPDDYDAGGDLNDGYADGDDEGDDDEPDIPMDGEWES